MSPSTGPVVVDAHQHFWDPAARPYPWLTAATPAIHRRFDVEDLRPLLTATGVRRTVLVQSADHREDTDAMLEQAHRYPEVAGVVGWVPLHDPAAAADELDRLRRDPVFVGVRTLVHDDPDPDLLVRPEVVESLGLLAAAGVPFDVVAVLPRHLEHVSTLAERHPTLKLVVDHLGHPPIGADDGGRWADLLRRAAEHPTVHAKVSGLYPVVGDPSAWSAADLAAPVRHALEVFGPQRLMVGGDWPVSVLHGGYVRVWGALRQVLAGLPDADRDRLFGGTAREFYGLSDALLGLGAEPSAGAPGDRDPSEGARSTR